MSPQQRLADAQILVRLAARGLARSGLVHAYGHCSTRIDAHHFLVCAPRPMGLVRAGEDGTIVPVTGDLPAGVLGEVRVHQAIYVARPDVSAVCRVMPPSVMALSVMRLTPLPRHGPGTYFYPCPALWDDPQLLRTDEQATALAATLGAASAVVMRGNGAVTVGTSLERAAVFAWYLEDAARMELAVRSTGLTDSPLLNADECARRATDLGGIFERMWDFMIEGDPEARS